MRERKGGKSDCGGGNREKREKLECGAKLVKGVSTVGGNSNGEKRGMHGERGWE